MTDQELLMLEQLCYLDCNVASATGVSNFSKIDINVYQNKTINEILQVLAVIGATRDTGNFNE